MANETLRFDIIGNDRVSPAFDRAAKSSGELSRKMDAAARSSSILDEALKRQERAAGVSADATLALARADKILEEAQHGLRDGALEAELALKKEQETLKRGFPLTIKTDEAKRKLLEIDTEARRLRDKFPEFRLIVDDRAAKAKLVLFAAEARAVTDEINRRLSGGGGRGGGILSGLGGALGSAGGAVGQAGSVIGSAGPYAIGGLVGLAALLGPSLLGLGIGGGVGVLGVGGALAAGGYAQQQVAAAQQAVKAAQSAGLSQQSLAATIAGLQARLGLAPAQNRASALAQANTIASLRQRIAAGTGAGATAAQRAAVPGLRAQLAAAQARYSAQTQGQGVSAAGLRSTLAIDQARYAQGAGAAAALPGAQARLAQDQAFLAPFTGLQSAVQQLGGSALMSFAKSIAPILGPVAQILRDMRVQIEALRPVMAPMFAASLPFIKMFANLLLPIGATLMPAFTDAMNQMVKSGALKLMSQGLLILVKGLAGFITALGPGMRSSAMIFRDVTVIIGAALRGLGLAMAWVANAMENVFHSSRLYIHYISRDFDGFRHGTAVTFDGLRHDIAHIWDVLWDNTTGRAIRAVHDIEHWLDDARHWIRQVFGGDLAGFFTKTLPGWWDAAIGLLSRRFITPFKNGIKGAWDWVVNNVWTPVSTFLTRTLPGWFGSGVSAIYNSFVKIRDAIGGPVHWVGKHVLDPLDSFINKILSFVGIHATLPTGLAAGGRITAGTGPTADDVLIRASRGETVVSAAHSQVLAPLFSAVGVPGYAKGGKVGQNPPMPGGHGGGVPAGPHGQPAGATIAGFLGKAADVIKIGGDLLAGNAGAAGRALADLAGHGTGGAGGQLAATLGALPGLLIKDIVKAIISKASGSGSSIVSYAMQFIGKIPYVWGGTSVPGGADCSGFTQAVYGHFGIQAPRTSEQQYAWARHSGAVPGALAFYVSAAGGPPPGHVAIVHDGSMVISQGGGMGPRLMPVNAMPLMGFGVPPGGFGRAVAGGATGGTMSAGQVASTWMSVGGPARAASNMARIAFAESGDVPSIVQQGQPPGLTGWGLWQITPTSGIWQNGAFGNLLNASNNARAALSLYRASGYLPWASDPVASSLIAQGISYDRGGWLMPGLTLAYNGTGRPEPVGGGNTYVINVTLPPGSDREHGRRIVGYIKSFEKGSGAGWRK